MQTTQKEIKNLNRTAIVRQMIKLIILKLPMKKSSDSDGFILPNIWRMFNIINSQTLPQNRRGYNTSQLILWGQSYINTKDIPRKENYRPTFLMNINVKILKEY